MLTVLLGINIRTHNKFKCAAMFLKTNARVEVDWRSCTRRHFVWPTLNKQMTK